MITIIVLPPVYSSQCMYMYLYLYLYWIFIYLCAAESDGCRRLLSDLVHVVTGVSAVENE